MDVIDGTWISARLDKRRGSHKALADAMGIRPDQLAKILKGKRQVQAQEIPRVLAYFESETRETAPARGNPSLMIDVYDVQASAGGGAMVDSEYVVERLSFPPDFLSRLTRTPARHLAIISVKGESMAPTLQDDDLVMLDTTKTSLDWDGLFVLRWGDALHVKRVGRSAGGAVRIISDNPAYPPIEIPRAEVEVIGRVIWMGKKV